MRVLEKEEVIQEKIKIVRKLRECLFIHPTDTVYGIGCNAEDRRLVRKLRSAKEQFTRPLSVIAPSMQWIKKNCVTKGAEEWLEKLPGPYTLILNLKKENIIPRNVNLGKKTIGVRIPNHWFSDIVHNMGIPVITTSANITGGNIMTNLNEIHEKLRKACEYVIYDGQKIGNASTIVDLSKEKTEILRN